MLQYIICYITLAEAEPLVEALLWPVEMPGAMPDFKS